MTMHLVYGSVETGEGVRGRGAEGAPARGGRHTRVAALLGLWALALVLATVAVTVGVKQRTVLDDKVDDPLAGLDETVHKWTDTHADGYNPEKQNVLNDKDAFEVPFVGYADKDLKWAAPSEPETNVLDYLPTGQFSEPKSMELRALLGPYPAPANVWGDGDNVITLNY